MTPDELRARVERFVVEECKGRWPAVSLIESLCREMVAEGLTMAADDAKKRQIHAESNAEGQNEEDCRMWLEVGRGHWYQEQWCRAKAQQVKENHETKKA